VKLPTLRTAEKLQGDSLRRSIEQSVQPMLPEISS
jgi:hypothetical protein